MPHRALPHAAVLRRAHQDVGPVPTEPLIRPVPVIGVLAGSILVVRVNAALEAFAASSPAPSLLSKTEHPGQPVGSSTLEDQWHAAAAPAPTA
ncbi:hypothetical protein ACFYR1_49765 [Streptomyces canus]|uniref:hypothetical protein n=1 Tax=Streptomyces canus TaxID=58343 RepID=UPI003690168D